MRLTTVQFGKVLMVSGLVAASGLSGGLVGCASPGKDTAVGAGVGAAAGAALGAVVGHQTGNRGGGALIGAALGSAMGGVVGNRLDKQAKELKTVAETRRTDEGVITKLKSDILFDTGRAQLKNGATDNLTKMASILKKYPEDVLTIKGYTDSTGSKSINDKLSAERADSVKQQLVAAGIPVNTITTVGMADANPVAPNDTLDGRSQNRRVEVEIVADPSKIPAKDMKSSDKKSSKM